MEEGSMRVDANVSMRRAGTDELGTRCEIKNLNSTRSLVRAIEHEARRQVDLLSAGERIVQQTRHWDEAEGRTQTLRSKEEADDYRYFPEPDLVPLEPDAAWVAAVDAALPALPAARRRALSERTGAGQATAALVVERDLDALVLAAVDAGGDPDRLLTRAANDLAGADVGALTAAAFAAVSRMEADAALTATQAKAVLAELVAGGGDPRAIAAARGFEAMGEAELAAAVDEAVASDPAAWQRFVAGDPKVAGLFVGKVMKATSGKADGKAVSALLRQRAAG
jgi:aspartyl-tRNA(Asn)/glutamyl-tRNA(Gln) amidotransferase subunit B